MKIFEEVKIIKEKQNQPFKNINFYFKDCIIASEQPLFRSFLALNKVLFNYCRLKFVLLTTLDFKKDEVFPKWKGTTQVGETYYLHKFMAIMGGIIIHTYPKKKLIYMTDKREGGHLDSNYTINYLLQYVNIIFKK